MSNIHFKRTHPLTLAQAKKVVQKTADDLADEYGLQSDWNGSTLGFNRSGVNGTIKVTESTIELEVKLGFLFKPFQAKFEKQIAHRLDELLLAAAPDGVAAKPAVKSSAKKKAADKKLS